MDKVSEDLLFELVKMYCILEGDRDRFIGATKVGAPFPLSPELIAGIRKTANDLAQLRRRLGLGGVFLGEAEDRYRVLDATIKAKQ